MDIHEVTNQQFLDFVNETGYITTAEKPINWNELKKQLPPNTPKPSKEFLLPGSLVFTKTKGPVSLLNESKWWSWVQGASWKHPEGPGSDIKNKMNLFSKNLFREDTKNDNQINFEHKITL